MLPGEYIVTDRDVMLVTVLGSCVSACIRDPLAQVGGMNHFMLPDLENGGVANESARYGSYAMEMLINELLKRGAARNRLECKVFGGGAVLAGFTVSNVGKRNGQFVQALPGHRRPEHFRRGPRPVRRLPAPRPLLAR